MPDRRPRAFSGVQPTGGLHLGNYLGAIRPFVDAQAAWDGFLCVVDLHALTTLPDPGALRRASREVAALHLACGIDPERTTLFLQSHVPAHTELAWLLTCATPLGWLLRMTQLKDRLAAEARRAAGGGATASLGAGVLAYPVLMAADILLYRSEIVPVGEDQRQHVELARDLVARVHGRYGELFTLPEARVSEAGARVMGLDDPTRKMSKSAPGRHHRVELLDPPERVRAVIGRAVTDAGVEVACDPRRPGVRNLVTLYAALARVPPREVVARFEGAGYGRLKRELAELVVAELEPIQRRYAALKDRASDLDLLLARGAARARSVAETTLSEVRARMGLLRPG